jgi:outer membrane protein assembly factor BamB
MYRNKLKIPFVIIGITIIFISPIVTPIIFGQFNSIQEKNMTQYLDSNFFDSYHQSESFYYKLRLYGTSTQQIYSFHSQIIGQLKKEISSPVNADGPMDSPWPMYCRDVRHTGQSPYSTMNTTGVEKWRTPLSGWVEGSPVIDKKGVIYIGCDGFFAVYPNGTIKWASDTGVISSAPTIDEDGIIYTGSIWMYPNNYLYAFYPNGTIKWKYATSSLGDIHSSPVIGNDGTIYFGDEDAYINALYPNGTLRWRYQTFGAVLSSPAIGDDETVYCGSHDGNLYALYPNDGTVKWKFGTGGWVRTAPCIAEDGTIYCVSLDNYLYAVNPNGTMKWRTDVGAGTSPTIGQDGTIYAGWNVLHAVNPVNGSIKWVFNPGPNRCIEGGTPAHSADGTIYCGVIYRIGDSSQGGEIIAINPDGTEKWRETIADFRVQSAPAIAEDGTIYIGSTWGDRGYLHAFGPLDPHAPTAPTITGQTNGKIETAYTYTFTSTSPLGRNIYYTVDWGDGTTTGWLGLYNSGEPFTLDHSWQNKGTYLIKARAKDTDNLWGPWGTLSVTMPYKYEKPIMNFLEWLFMRFPHMFPLLRYLMRY